MRCRPVGALPFGLWRCGRFDADMRDRELAGVRRLPKITFVGDTSALGKCLEREAAVAVEAEETLGLSMEQIHGYSSPVAHTATI